MTQPAAPNRTVLVLLAFLALMAATTTASAASPAAPRGVTATRSAVGAVTIRWSPASGTVRAQIGRAVRTAPAGKGRLVFPRPARVSAAKVRRCMASRCSPWRSVVIRPVRAPTGPPPPAGSPTAGGCPVLPASHPINQRIDSMPVDGGSAAYVAAIGSGSLHPDFGSGRWGDYGIPYSVVAADQPVLPIRFTAYGDESDPGPYPIPLTTRIEGGAASDGDRHVLVVRQGDCRLFEMYRAFPTSGGWNADAGAVWNLRTGDPRPAGWTSADAAGLPILPLLVRYDEVAAGSIDHAIRVTVPRSQRAYVAPARHFASSSTDPTLPPMGLRLRLKASYPIDGLPPQARVIATAMKRYGLIVADNGSGWFFQGNPDPRWDDDQLDRLKSIPGSAFEAVETGPLTRG